MGAHSARRPVRRLDDEPEAFHQQVRRGFLRLAEIYPDRVRVVDATGAAEAVFVRVLSVLPEELR